VVPERRGSYRCTVNGPRRAAMLHGDGKLRNVEVVDESAGGLAIEFDGTFAGAVGQIYRLQYESAWEEVQVMNIQITPRELEQDADPQQGADVEGRNNQQPDESRVRLGLLRVRDIEPWEITKQPGRGITWTDVKSVARALIPLRKSLGAAVGMTVGAVAVGVGVMCVLELTAPVAEVKTADYDVQSPVSDEFQIAVPGGKAGGRAAPLKPRSKPTASFKRVTRSLASSLQGKSKGGKSAAASAHPNFLLQPEIARVLSLSEQQQARLVALTKEVGEEVESEIAALGSSSVRVPQNANEIEVGRKATAVLTARQREALQRLMARDAAAPSEDSPEE